jgi:hypothetical protein
MEKTLIGRAEFNRLSNSVSKVSKARGCQISALAHRPVLLPIQKSSRHICEDVLGLFMTRHSFSRFQ